jgi:hypothetical protein
MCEFPDGIELRCHPTEFAIVAGYSLGATAREEDQKMWRKSYEWKGCDIPQARDSS